MYIREFFHFHFLFKTPFRQSTISNHSKTQYDLDSIFSNI